MKVMEPKVTLRNTLNFRVDDVVITWLIGAAARAKMPPSSYARKVLERAAARDLLGNGDAPQD
jgi:hypothetical protein